MFEIIFTIVLILVGFFILILVFGSALLLSLYLKDKEGFKSTYKRLVY